MFRIVITFTFFLNIICSSLCSKIHEAKSRAFDPELSDLPHETGGIHDSQYDHEAFLGKEGATEYGQYSPTESKERLAKLVKKIDTDSDGFVSENELKIWIDNISKVYLIEDRDRAWADYNMDVNQKLGWEDYKTKYIQDEEEDIESADSIDELSHMLERDKRRWAVADLDGDGLLSKDEFMSFLHPESSPHMHDIVIDETIAELDTNKDGFIDQLEYIHDMWTPSSNSEPEPVWLVNEREQFSLTRDKNGDGKLDRSEIAAWVLPEEYGHIESETKHLIEEADSNHDGKLSSDEIVEHYDLFVGSQATNYGQVLHDEL